MPEKEKPPAMRVDSYFCVTVNDVYRNTDAPENADLHKIIRCGRVIFKFSYI